MNCSWPGWWRLLVFCCFLASLTARAGEGKPTLTAEQIVKKLMERAQSPGSSDRRAHYAYTKQVVTEELDGKDQVKDKKEKTFLVQSGYGYLLNMTVNGEALSEKEMKKQNQKVIEARQKLTGSKSGKSDDNWEQFINSDLTSRYQFTLLREEILRGRRACVLSFRPLGKDLPVRQLSDRLLNQLTGTVWVDALEFEIAKAELNLQAKVALGGIMEIIGNLKSLRYTVERVRIGDLVWFNRSTQGEYEGRKLWSGIHIKTHTESRDFHKVSPGENASIPPLVDTPSRTP
jgi:hypothetical protein